jgi:hypothetical protein
MPRAARRLFAICSAVSLAACVASSAYWVRARFGSQYFADNLPLRWVGRDFSLKPVIAREGLRVQLGQGWPPDSQRWQRDWFFFYGS